MQDYFDKYMKKAFIFLFVISSLLIFGNRSFAQVDECKWTFSVVVKSAEEAELIFTAKVADGWHLYSQEYKPNPMYFDFEKSANYERAGGVKEPPYKRIYDEYLEADMVYFETHTVKLVQKIKIKTAQAFEIKGEMNFQVCLEDGQCKAAKQPFLFKVDPSQVTGAATDNDSDGDGVPNDEDACPDEPGLKALKGCPDSDGDGVADKEDKCPTLAGNPDWEGCPDSDSDGIPDHKDRCPGVAGTGENGCPVTGGPDGEGSNTITPEELNKENLQNLEQACGSGSYTEEDRSFWGIFIGGFLGGLLALLTPCVFPMIPLTVSFFTKQSKTRALGIRNSFTYGFSIIIIYTLLGFLITRIAGANALNAMSTSAFWNLLFFVLFIIFAISFLGAFEITLPSRFVNAMDKQSNRAGLVGIFFMAFTLSLVSFSCTGPIIGTLLVEASRSGSTTGPLIGMFGFSLALALPFGLFAAFPGWLQSLPKSGSWMDTVKKSLGFLEIALALKFLSTVDLAYHWGILKREIFIGIWVLTFLTWALYAFGILGLVFKGKKIKLNGLKIVLGGAALAFAIYLVPGFWGANLKLLSGLAPPKYYSLFNNEGITCPLGIDCYHDYEEGMAAAIASNKPVMIDFTGHGCVNCRKMEEHVWTKKEIFDKLNKDFILISLYVDDKRDIPAELQPTSPSSGKKLTTIGDRWSDFQQFYFNKNSQPQYVLLDNDGRLLAPDAGYTDQETFNAFLEEGLCRFKLRETNATKISSAR